MSGIRRDRGQSSYQPAVFLAAAGAAGIVCDRWCNPGPLIWLTAAPMSLVLWSVAFRQRAVGIGALSVLLAVFSTAALWHHARWRLFPADDLGLVELGVPQAICVQGLCCTTPRLSRAPPADPLSTVPSTDQSRFKMHVEALRHGQNWRIASGLVAVSVKGCLTSVQCGDRIRLFAHLSMAPEPLNPGERSVRDFERSERRLCRLHVNSVECIQVVERGASWRPSQFMSWLRTRFERYLRRYIPAPRAGLACAILLGTREDVDRQRNEEFMTTGTVHLLAISGLNVGILAYVFWIAGRLGLISRACTLFGGILFVIWYALLTEAQPPVVRAAVLVTVMCLARLCGRQSLNFNTLAVAAIVVLVQNPTSLFLVGTQLSFLAVAIMACVPELIPVGKKNKDPLQQLIRDAEPWYQRWLRRLTLTALQATALSTVIWVISLPLVMYRFHVVSPVATVLNPLVCLPMAIALFAGFGVMIFGWFAPPAALVCGWLCDVCLWGMEYSIDQALKIPGNHFWGPAPPLWWVTVFYAAFGVERTAQRFRISHRWLCAVGAAWFGLGAWLTFGPGARSHVTSEDQLRCTFIAVGHGTSALLEFPDGRTLLYDGGRLGFSYIGGQIISSVLWSKGLTHLDGVVISHADADHFNALPFLFQRFSVGRVYVSPTMYRGSQPAVDALSKAFRERGIQSHYLSRGDRFSVRSVQIEVLHPPRQGTPGSDNANSIVLLIEFSGRRLLLPGDLESPGIEQLLTMASIDCYVLMAPHHGSTRSNPAGFAEWSQPEIVVISGAAKRDASSVRAAYEHHGARVFHTAFDGAVEITMHSDGVDVATFCGPPH